MTNTLASIYASSVTGISGACDGWISIGLLITGALVGYALYHKFAPKRKKVV